MDHFRTQYERFYAADEYYWGLEPAGFLDDLLAASEGAPEMLRVLDIGCGEGKDAVYLAQKGCRVTAFDITESGIRKTHALARARGVQLDAFTADVNDFEVDGRFDIVYSTGTIQYLHVDRIRGFFEKLWQITAPGGIAYFNVFVEKPFLELPPDWDLEERMWQTGELLTHFAQWRVKRCDEVIFEDHSNGIPHYHCMDIVMAQRP